MDSYTPQSGAQVRTGHEEGDFNVRGIILFIVILVVSAAVTFVAAGGLMRLFEWIEVTYIDQKPTPVRQQLNEQRGELAQKEGVRPQPDWANREIDEKVLVKTFAAPRLQYDDAADMDSFLKSEAERLDSAGSDSDGSIHIPISRAIDLLSDPKRGLPQVTGTFTPAPPMGNLTDVSDAAQRRLNELNAGQAGKKK